MTSQGARRPSCTCVITTWTVQLSDTVYDIDVGRTAKYSECMDTPQGFVAADDYPDAVMQQVGEKRRQPMALVNSDGVRVVEGVVPFCDGCHHFFEAGETCTGCLHFFLCPTCRASCEG